MDVFDTDHIEFDTPVFWHVSKSGGTTMVDIFSTCLNFRVAAEIGVLEGHDQDETLKVVTLNEGLRYVNVDTTTSLGIQRAKQLNLVPSGLADVIVSPLFHDLLALFDHKHRGRMFTVLRHPIDRAVSMFFYLQNATWEETYDPTLKQLTLLQYARSGKAENNWMVRFLTDTPTGPLDTHHILLAREILRRKFLIGLLSNMDDSMTRFGWYFGWNELEHSNVQECVRHAWTNKQTHPQIEEGSEMWNALLDVNYYDMELYMYARELYQQQRLLFDVSSRNNDNNIRGNPNTDGQTPAGGDEHGGEGVQR